MLPVRFISLETKMDDNNESKGELWLMAVFVALLILIALRFFRR